MLVAAFVVPALVIDALWFMGVTGGPFIVLAQTLAVPVHLGAVVALPILFVIPTRVGRFAAAAVTVVVLAAGVSMMLGDRGGGPTGLPAELTVYSANLSFYRGDESLGLEQVREAQPDVAVFQEVSPRFLELLKDGLPGYELVEAEARDDAFGAAMFSRLEVVESQIEQIDGSPMPTGRFRTEIGTVTVIGVHTLPPFADAELWSRQHAELAQVANRSNQVVVIGDFNSIGRLQPMRDLVDEGNLLDAHREVGTGLGLTWPDTGIGPIPGDVPVARIDRALYRGLVATEFRVGDAAGSDHRPILASFTVTPPQSD